MLGLSGVWRLLQSALFDLPGDAGSQSEIMDAANKCCIQKETRATDESGINLVQGGEVCLLFMHTPLIET